MLEVITAGFADGPSKATRYRGVRKNLLLGDRAANKALREPDTCQMNVLSDKTRGTVRLRRLTVDVNGGSNQACGLGYVGSSRAMLIQH